MADQELDGVDEDLKALEAAGQRDLESGAQLELGVENLGPDRVKNPAEDSGMESVVKWMVKLPRNVTVGVLDAAIQAGHFVAGAGRAVQEADQRSRASGIDQEGQPTSPLPIGPGDSSFDDLDKTVSDFRNTLAVDSNTSDEITQGIAQFTIPFLGWSKLLRAEQGLTLGSRIVKGLAAESATVATSFDPHAGRFADLYRLGQESEGRLGKVLNTLAPDGSLLNDYINFQVDRSNETEGLGRFKNVLDNLLPSAALSGVIWAGAKLFKSGGKAVTTASVPAEAAPAVNVSGRPKGKAFEIDAFRGVPAGVDPLDNSNSYGKVLYFTPDKTVASAYGARGGNVTKHKLAFKNMLEAKDPPELNKLLGLPPETGLDAATNAARDAGYDGLTFETGTGPSSREYVDLRPVRGAQ